jgi:tRNA-specific 2-thiouridylase
LHTVNFSVEYWDNVFTYFLQEYRQGRTPNPDIICNREIKFKVFLQYALQLGAEFIATGHYARSRLIAGKYQLLKGCDPAKDQSYFLYALEEPALTRTLFPVGELLKTHVRQIATQVGFINYAKKDSTGICFIGERKFKEFLQRYLPAQPGKIETAEGVEVGEHEGLMYYTLGQRQGLKLGGRRDAAEAPWYVVGKDLARNVLMVVQGRLHPRLLSTTLICRQIHWIAGMAPALPLICAAKVRYRQQEQGCTLTWAGDDRYKVDFSEAQWAVTPGQSVVFYLGDHCLGGGIIDEYY